MINAQSLAARLRSSTAALHLRVERSGYIGEILKQRASKAGYGLFLRNLEPAYGVLETALADHRAHEILSAFDWPPLFRHQALCDDLAALAAGAWHEAFQGLAEGSTYAKRIEQVSADTPHRLLGHAYVRYVGDLSGGQIVKALLRKTPGLSADQLGFYDFDGIKDTDAFKAGFRNRLDRIGHDSVIANDIIDEAMIAFQCNLDLSLAVQRKLQTDRT